MRSMSCLRLTSRCGVPTAPRKYLLVTMLTAFTDQDSGNSTPRCSKLIEPSRQLVMTTSRRSHTTSSYGCTPGVVWIRWICIPLPPLAGAFASWETPGAGTTCPGFMGAFPLPRAVAAPRGPLAVSVILLPSPVLGNHSDTRWRRAAYGIEQAVERQASGEGPREDFHLSARHNACGPVRPSGPFALRPQHQDLGLEVLQGLEGP